MQGRVTLVGAGPGDARLITVLGLERLRSADVVIHDRLIDTTLLHEAPRGCEVIDAGKAPGEHKLSQEEINALLVAQARRGFHVVRLKGGDPFLFGRGAEEVDACRACGIPVEVVPGVSSALAAPAAAGISVTRRGVARTLTITTLHESDGLAFDDVDFPSLAAADTLCVLMSRALVHPLCAGLIAAGRSPTTPAAIVERATMPGQRVVTGDLNTLSERADREGITNPAVIVIGEVVTSGRAAPRAATVLLQSPLFARRIVVTRPRTASAGLIGALRRRGANVFHAPLIDVVEEPPHSLPPLAEYDWIVFSSLHGVRGFFAALEHCGLDSRALAGAKLAAVGPKTASELRRFGLRADLVPRVHRAHALVQELAQRIPNGARVLFPGGTLAMDVIPNELRARGARVDVLEVYATQRLPLSPEIRRRIEAGVDAILLYSPSAAGALRESGVDVGRARIAAIGPTTADAARRLGLSVHLVPEDYGDEGMLASLENAFAESEVRG